MRMTQKYVALLLTVVAICHGLTEKPESTTELSTKHASDGKSLVSIRDKNASKSLHTKNVDDQFHFSQERTTDKRIRTAIHGSPHDDARDNCCGSRFGTDSSGRPDYSYNRIPTERHPSQYSDRLPVDRYGWQTQGRPPGAKPSSGSYDGGYSGSGSYGGTKGDRFGSRPSFGSESSGRPSYGYSYGDSGHGSYTNGRPNGYGSPGTNGYGISGTLADGGEFGPADPAEGGTPHPGSNIQTQKAVALKALAGVALIGAAAALASNPVLLPIGIISGRKKRSKNAGEDDFQMEYVLQLLRENFSKVGSSEPTDKLYISPICVARLTCEIQKDYLAELRKEQDLHQVPEFEFANLVQRNVLDTKAINPNVKKLIRMAINIGSGQESCKIFACSFTKNG